VQGSDVDQVLHMEQLVSPALLRCGKRKGSRTLKKVIELPTTEVLPAKRGGEMHMT